MKTLYIKYTRKILQNKKELEDKLNIKISVKGSDVTISGKGVDEYFASRVIRAMDFPFLVEDCLLLKSEDYLFEVLDIKDFTRRKDINVIKARIIGTKGKTLRVLQELSNCLVTLKDNNIAIIGKSEDIEFVRRAVISLIQGSKQGNVYAYLEKARKRDRYRI